MTRIRTASIVLASCLASASVGYWFGFREALEIGISADKLAQAVLATEHLKEIRTGSTKQVASALEFDVDVGLIWGDKALRHPLASYLEPLWGMDTSAYEKYAARVAKYRRDFASSAPFSGEHRAMVHDVVERYAPAR